MHCPVCKADPSPGWSRPLSDRAKMRKENRKRGVTECETCRTKLRATISREANWGAMLVGSAGTALVFAAFSALAITSSLFGFGATMAVLFLSIWAGGRMQRYELPRGDSPKKELPSATATLDADENR